MYTYIYILMYIYFEKLKARLFIIQYFNNGFLFEEQYSSMPNHLSNKYQLNRVIW